jgi:hypothetical protein
MTHDEPLLLTTAKAVAEQIDALEKERAFWLVNVIEASPPWSPETTKWAAKHVFAIAAALVPLLDRLGLADAAHLAHDEAVAAMTTKGETDG